MNAVEKLQGELKKRRVCNRPHYLMQVYKQIGVSKRGRVCKGEFNRQFLYDAEQRDGLKSEMIIQLVKYGLARHASRLANQKYVDILPMDGSGTDDSYLIEVKLNGVRYAFRAKEVRDLRINPDDDQNKGMQRLTEAYRVLWKNENDQAILERIKLNENKSKDLSDRILFERN